MKPQMNADGRRYRRLIAERDRIRRQNGWLDSEISMMGGVVDYLRKAVDLATVAARFCKMREAER